MEGDDIDDLALLGEDFEDELEDLDEEYCPFPNVGIGDNSDDNVLVFIYF
jgi:hypothetical protein